MSGCRPDGGGRTSHERRVPAASGGGCSSTERIPGRNRNENVTIAPRTPAPISVGRAPKRLAAGPVNANDSGSNPIEMNQSRLETRPSSCRGTSRCLVVAQTIVPAGLERVEQEAREHRLPRRVRQAEAGDRERRQRPRDVHERDEPARGSSPPHEQRGADRADPAHREDEPQAQRVAAPSILHEQRAATPPAAR